MSMSSKSRLSLAEIRRLEARLQSEGFRRTADQPSELNTHEYSVHRWTAPGPSGSQYEHYSICWRN
ncbi:MAG: hypothetical protein ABFS23_01040 [Pseudomonadota bacterium]